MSFCLPVYNVEAYIEPCIRSIQKQSLDGINIEILCIDDKSKDGSFQILTTLAAQEPRIRVLQNEQNRGVSFTRNRLIQEAIGTYIWFVDPDDLLFPDAAEPIIRMAMQKKADVLVGDYLRFEDGESAPVDYPQRVPFCVKCGFARPEDNMGNGMSPMSAVWGGVIRREFLIQNQVQFNEKLAAQEDTLFYWEMKIKSPVWYKCNQFCYLYRQRSTSITHAFGEERSVRFYESLCEILNRYMQQRDSIAVEYLPELERNIHQGKEGVALKLAEISNTHYVIQQYAMLKKAGVYPYPQRSGVWNSNYPLPVRLVQMGIPNPWFFWMFHFAYKFYGLYRKIRK